MPDQESTGPSAATKALIAVLALPVILVLLFIVVGRINSSQKSVLPALQTKGLKWAQARANIAGFDTIKSHDALGRNRGNGDTKSWMVCFQEPATGKYARNTKLEFGVVRVTETCPSKDQGRIDRAGLTMPNFADRTAYMANVALGDDASVRYIEVSSQRGVDHDLGDYRVCAQEPAAGAPWDGVPVKLAVVPYEQNCNSPKMPKDDNRFKGLDAAEIFQRVLDSLPR